MIAITVYRSSKDKTYKGFECTGHAGYAQAGNDIVCAAVSMLVINTINAIEVYGGQKFSCETEEEIGLIRFQLDGEPTGGTELLLNAMVLGLREVEKQYHKKYLKLKFEEV